MAVMPFLVVCLFGLMMLTYIPQISLFFPNLLMGK